MSQTAKYLADIMATLMIVFIVCLTLISIAAIWKIVEVKDILYKSIFSFSILSVAYIIVVVASHYWEAHRDQNISNETTL